MRRRGAVLLLLGLAGRADAARAAPGKSSVARLLAEIDQSLRTAQGDSEMAFASLFSYDHQLELSLGREIVSMNKTLGKLAETQAAYRAEIKAATPRAHPKVSLVQMATRQKVSSRATAVLQVLRSAEVTSDGALLTPEAPESLDDPYKVLTAVRDLLSEAEEIRPDYEDVFAAFTQESDLVGSSAALPEVKMSPALLKRTLLALGAIGSRVGAQSSVEDAAKAASAQTAEAKLRGMLAETERAAEELALTADFSRAVMRRDAELRDMVEGSMKRKAEMVEASRLSHQRQLKILRMLQVQRRRRRSPPADSSAESPAFLQVKSEPNEDLLFEIETAIKHKADTHNILLRVKEMLHPHTEEGPSAESVVQDLGSVLKTLGDDQARANAAKRRCAAQKSHASLEAEDHRANLALLDSVQQHSRETVEAAQSNVKRIAAKSKALNASAHTFSKVVSHASKIFQDHSKNRATIIAAVQRAAQVVGGEQVQLLKQLGKELQVQERWERRYSADEQQLLAAFLSYIQDYQERLQERNAHYTRSLAALEVFGKEVAGDVSSQSGAVAASQELEKESGDLCAGILKFCENFHERRLKLMDTLKDLLPRLPQLAQTGAN